MSALRFIACVTIGLLTNGCHNREGNGAQTAKMEVARPQMFNGSSRKVLGFVTACKLYIRIKMGSNSGGADTVDLIICIERISRYMEEEHARRLGRRIMEI